VIAHDLSLKAFNLQSIHLSSYHGTKKPVLFEEVLANSKRAMNLFTAD
jgi:hypothetical protein